MKASQRLRLLRSPAAAIDALHSGAGTNVPVVHGDIKPANIVIRDEDNTAVLVDLGLARLIDGDGRDGLTLAYAPPERRQTGSRATVDGDNYSFIVTVASLMTGRIPPTGADGFLDLGVLRSQLVQRSAVTAQRPGLVMAIMGALEAPSDARPTRLEQWMDGAAESMTQATVEGGNIRTGEMPVSALEPTKTLPATAPEPAPKNRGRRVGLAAAIVVVLLLLAGIGGYALTRGGPRSSAATAIAPSTSPTTPAITTTSDPSTTTTTSPSTTTTTRSATTTPPATTTAATTTPPAKTTYLADTPPVEDSTSFVSLPATVKSDGDLTTCHGQPVDEQDGLNRSKLFC